MSKSFEKWFDKYNKEDPYNEEFFEENLAKDSWNACKNEILNILKENIIESETRDEKNWNYINEGVIEEIEKL